MLFLEINRWRQRAFEQAECLRCVYFIAWDREACGCDEGFPIVQRHGRTGYVGAGLRAGGDDPEQGGVGTRGSEGDPDAGGGPDDACGDFEEPQA